LDNGLELRQDYDVCLSDYCDIFECKEFPERTLKSQVFMDRNHNYEGVTKRFGQQVVTEPYRYYLMQ